jgi:hypothetical protein
VYFSKLSCLHSCGAPIEFYNLSDITKIDKNKYKLFIFLNTILIPENIQEYIKNELRDKYKFALHTTNYGSDDVLDVWNIMELTGIELKEYITDKIEYVTIENLKFGFTCPGSPLFEVTDPDATSLGYFENGKVGFAVKNKWFYSSLGNVPASVFRKVAQEAGVHLYAKVGYGLCVTDRFIAAYTTTTEDCELNLPYDAAFEELFDGGYYSTINRKLKYYAKKGSTKLFLIL